MRPTRGVGEGLPNHPVESPFSPAAFTDEELAVFVLLRLLVLINVLLGVLNLRERTSRSHSNIFSQELVRCKIVNQFLNVEGLLVTLYILDIGVVRSPLLNYVVQLLVAHC